MFKIFILSLMLVATTAFAGERSNQDANADHNILTPTAETINQGDLTFNSYELFFAGMSYGVTDDLQLTFTTLLPIVNSIPFVGLFTAKYKLMDNGNTAFAILPGLLYTKYEGASAGSFNLTAVFSMSLNQDNLLSFSSTMNIPFLENKTLDGMLFTFTAAINSRISKYVKLVAELSLAGAYANGEFHLGTEAMLFNYGIRFFNKDLAAMLSFLRPIITGDGENPIILGYPYVTFTAKF